eukprot:3563473-Pleurochrysis_carterae.AAC.3
MCAHETRFVKAVFLTTPESTYKRRSCENSPKPGDHAGKTRFPVRCFQKICVRLESILVNTTAFED